jgi:hypothetical protein
MGGDSEALDFLNALPVFFNPGGRQPRAVAFDFFWLNCCCVRRFEME